LDHRHRIDVLLWSAAAGVGSGIILASVLVAPDVRVLRFPGADKVGHATAYFAFSLLLLLAGVWRPGRVHGVWKGPAPALALAVGYGAVLEVVQGMVGRDAQILDVLADLLGAMVALLVWSIWRRRSAADIVPT
jgi:VanZ family protein